MSKKTKSTKYNIYRVDKTREKALIEKLESVGLEKIAEKHVGDFHLRFFFSRNPDEVDIWWTKVYSDFFAGISRPKNWIYFATLLISSDTLCYAISLGKSHFYLRNQNSTRA